MSFRFRFTAVFVAFAAVILVAAALLISRSARSSEESNLVTTLTDQSAENAELLGGTVSAYTNGGSLVGAAADSPLSIGFESLVMSTLLQNSDIVSLSVFDPDGSLVWTSAGNSPAETGPSGAAFQRALSGEIVTDLSRGIDYSTRQGELQRGDLACTYIPIADAGTGNTAQVLEVARDVSSLLDFRVDNTRRSMLNTLYPALGASLAVLLGIVIAAETMLNRSRRMALRQELAANASIMESEKLQLRNQQLQQMNKEHDRFLSMVSHELRTPLTSMLAFTEVLRRRQEGSHRDENLDRLELMQQNGRHLNSLIDSMLEVTRLHANEFEIVKQKLSFEELLKAVEKSGSSCMNGRRQELLVESSCYGLEITADGRRIQQALMNVLTNASLYSPEGSLVTLGAEQRGSLLKISVADEGPGIPDEERDHLFDQFQRGDHLASRSSSGLGLGLPIAKAIIDAHNGKISVRSQQGRGTLVTILLPINSADAVGDADLRDLPAGDPSEALEQIA